MLEGVNIWEALGGFVIGAVAWLGGRKTRGASSEAESAGYYAERDQSLAESDLYTQLRGELATMRAELTEMRCELDTERRRGRKMERHIWQLEGLMRKAGIEPPPLDDEPA